MHTWLYNLPRSAQVGKQNRKNRLSRPGWRSNHDGLKFGLEHLEDRVLLSITTETGAAITSLENAAFRGPVATFISPDNGPFTAVIHWGDGTSSSVNGSSVSGGPSPATFSVNGSHTYADEASDAISVVITDTSDSATGTVTGTATVSEGDRLTPGMEGIIDATEGIAFTGKVAYFTNVGYPGNPASDFTAAIDWGDGSTGPGTVGAVSGSAYTVTGSHVYADEGTHTTTVVLADNTPGATTATVTDQVAAFDASLTATGTAVEATAGTAFNGAVASFTDANPNAPLSDFSARIDWGDGTTTSGSVAANGSGGFNVTGTHTYTSSGSNPILVHIADVGGSTANATSTPTVSSTSAEVSISKSAPSTGTVGTNFDYTVTVTNGAGGVGAAAVTMTDTLPAGVTLVSATDTSGGAITHAGSSVTDVIGTLAAGATDTITIVVTPGSSTLGTTITNSASVTTTATNIGTPTTSSASTSISAPTVAITKSGTPSTINVGGAVQYLVIVTHSARDAVTGAVATDVVPAGLTIVSAYPNPPAVNRPTNPSGDTVTISGNTVTDRLGTLGQNGEAFLTINATAAPLPSGTTNMTLTNSASVAFAGTNITSNAVTTTISSTTPLLSISKVSTPEYAHVGGTVTYTITVTNSGGAAGAGAVVTDLIDDPSAFLNLQATDPAGTVTFNNTASGGVLVTDRLGAVPAYGTETLTITGRAAPIRGGDSSALQNTADLAFAGTATASNTVTTYISTVPVSAGVGFLAGVPGDGTPQTFIQNLYRELLGREPDSTGASFWVAYIQRHDSAAGRSQAITAFMNSPEYAIHDVTTLYQIILDRAPDAPGLQFWTDKMGRPGTPGANTGSADEKAIVAALFGSDEFYLQSGKTAQGWIGALYEDILGRATDRSGAAFWQHELAIRGAGDRDGIVRDLLTTPEAAHLVLDSFYPATGGASLLPTPGTPAGTGSTDLALITGDGWENLYLQGPFGSQPQGNDSFFDSLTGDASWDDVQLLLLETRQFDTNPYRPITS